MPMYPFKCKKCGHYEEQIFTIEQRPDSIPCPCGGKATRRIGVSSADCFAERPSWIASVAETVDPSKSHVEKEFKRNPTRENYNRFMSEKGLRHVEDGEKLGKNTKPIDMNRLNRRLTEQFRAKKRIHI